MRNSYKNIETRRETILELLSINDAMSITDLSQNLGVSEMTIRRDCNNLAKMGYVTQRLGVIRYISSEKNDNFDSRYHLKQSLGTKAAEFIDNNEIVFINSSSTALFAVKTLLSKKISIITNNGNISKFLSDHTPASLILAGGNLNEHNIMSGDIANQTFLSMRSDWSIIGCAGLSIEHGITTPRIEEATVNRNIIQNSRNLIVVADYSKFENVSNFTIGQISDIDILITDTFTPEKILNGYRKQGVQVIQVSQF